MSEELWTSTKRKIHVAKKKQKNSPNLDRRHWAESYFLKNIDQTQRKRVSSIQIVRVGKRFAQLYK